MPDAYTTLSTGLADVNAALEFQGFSEGFSPPPQVFKIALDYWNYFVPDVYTTLSTGLADANAAFAFGGAPAGGAAKGRKQLYAAVLSRLRLLMISRMAKPEEVRAHGPPVFALFWHIGCLNF